MADNIKITYLSIGLKSPLFRWDDYNNVITKQIGYLSRFIVQIDTDQVGFDGRIRYRSRLYIRSASWFFYKLKKAEARAEGKTLARRICEGRDDLNIPWSPIIGFSFETGLVGQDCDCIAEFK